MAAADRLCGAGVQLLEVDAAAISLAFDGVNTGTSGASSDAARLYDELQFTLGEGPCLIAGEYVGSLDLFRLEVSALDGAELAGALLADDREPAAADGAGAVDGRATAVR